MNKTQSTDKRRSTLGRWFRRTFFGKKEELSVLEEEALQSPFKTVARNFFANRLARMGLFVFLAIFIFVMVGPMIWRIDLSYQDNTQQHVAPGMNMLSVPEELAKNVRHISPSTTFSLGVDNNGKVYIWGHSKVTDTIDLKDIPQEVKDAHIVDVEAGYDHAVALDDKGKLYVWGNTRLGQDRLPTDLASSQRKGEDLHIRQMVAGNQFSALITGEGKLVIWGNGNLNDIKIKKAYRQTKFKKVTANINTYLALTEDGAVVYPGFQDNAYSRIPAGLESGVVDIASSSFTNAALKEDGSVVVWGNVSSGENQVPKVEKGKIVRLFGGRYHYAALTDQNELICWGGNKFGQSTPPTVENNDHITDVYVGGFQNYAVTQKGKLYKWGLSGYLMGTDHLGRDILTRIVNGGRVTMTVGAVSVMISLIIGVVLGGISGYFGGRADMLIMRLSEIVGGLPFLPFALILSAIIGTRISVEQRMYLIMVVLGVLSWPGLCRLVRAQILAQREMEFVTAAKAMGVKEKNIVFKHIIPNVISTILVSATLDFATSMLTESTLSFLGFGIAPPTPTWGNMLTGANNSIIIQQYWWRWVFTAVIFSVCTICINLIGDGLRDAIDPKSNER